MIVLTLFFIIIDFVSKRLIISLVGYEEYVSLIKNFLGITYVKNTGIAWSLFDNNQIFVAIISLLIILVISYYSFKNKPKNNIEKMAYSLVLGGAIGNFIDRIIYRGVIDFISVKIFGYDYPIFNLADSFIVIGVIILLIYTYKGDKRGDRSK